MAYELWPGFCALAALGVLLVLIIRYQVHAFAALLLVSLGLGLAAGLPPERVVEAMQQGSGAILRDVALLLALGAMLGRILEVSGAAELIASRLLRFCGERNASLAIALAAFLIGIPILFNVAFLLLIPIVWRMQRQTGRSLLFYLLPLTFGLGMTHSLVPPHPGIVGAVRTLAGTEPGRAERVMVETIFFGTLLSLPLTLLGWFGPGRIWAKRQLVEVPAQIGGAAASLHEEAPAARSFGLALLIVLAPLVLSMLGFGARLLQEQHRLPESFAQPFMQREDLPPPLAVLGHTPLDWLQFLGKPAVALAVPTALAFWCYGLRRGWDQKRLAKLTGDALQDVGSMLFLFGAAGGFKQVIEETGAGRALAEQLLHLPLSPVAAAYVVTALVRIALGSATAAILTAAALLTGLAQALPGQETLLVLAVACGATFMTQPADSGFWMVKEYGNLSTREVMLRFNVCRITMSLAGVAILLMYEQWR
jgi:gluconate transporter